jgi:hypothetical protein
LIPGISFSKEQIKKFLADYHAKKEENTAATT